MFALVWAVFVRQDGLGTFADDSVSYLVMAQAFSPWREASGPVAAVLAMEAFHPPLFPLLLALTGAAHDIALAHTLNAVVLAACLPLAYYLGLRWLSSSVAAGLATLCIVLLPATWIHVRGVLSEPLFCLALLAAMATIESRLQGWKRLAVLAVVLAALVLTRTVGLAMALAYGLWGLAQPGTVRERAVAVSPVLAAFGAYGLWIVLRPAGVVDPNACALAARVAALAAAPEPWSAFAAGMARQAVAMAEAWAGTLMLFWVDGSLARPILAALVGVFAVAGLSIRLAAARPDAWMIGTYLVVYLLWPFYDQMTRFIFPVVPVLVLYAFVPFAGWGKWMMRPAVAPLVAALTIASLAAPGLAFIYQRAKSNLPHAHIIDWYRTPDLAAARARAQIHLDLMADMDAIRELTGPQDPVIWVAPAYIALLAGRYAVAAPPHTLSASAYRERVRDSGARFVFLSRYHPRDTIREDAWRAGIAALNGVGNVVHFRPRAADGGAGSVLIRLGSPPAAR
jgi:hypothetical protein